MKTEIIFILLLSVSINMGQITNIKVNSSNLTNCNEPSIAVNPQDPDNIAIGVNNTYCFYTYDNGKTWNEVKMESSFGVWGDPSLGFDSNGNLYFAHLSGEPPLNGRWADRIVIQKSTDGGATWTDGTYTGLNRPKHEDKCWMTIADKSLINANSIYIAWTENDEIFNPNPGYHSRILFSYSEDGGITWTQPLNISDVEGDCNDEDNTVEGAVPAIGPGGEIYVAWSGPVGIVFDKSLDGGNTFGEDISISPQVGGWYWGQEVSGVSGNGLPQTLCDIGESENRGNIYIVWADQRNGASNTDIFLRKSSDKGETWSDAVRVNNDSTERAQFFPWAAIDPETGNLYIVFYDRRNTSGTDTEVYIAKSVDGGETFSNFKISEEPFSNETNEFLGDYINMQFLNGKLYPVWTRIDDGERSIVTAIIEENTLTSAKKEEGIFQYKLYQNFPNPFNPVSTISFQVKRSAHVNLTVYDALGKEITQLVNSYKRAGEYNVIFDGNKLASGTYIYKITIGDWTESKKMILMK